MFDSNSGRIIINDLALTQNRGIFFNKLDNSPITDIAKGYSCVKHSADDMLIISKLKKDDEV
jgi:hypothetical protein